ncbi:hypothetical protein PGTUg99_010953 [Puccinia graminis f. sp. tritici]|uniref:Uncharacterized protein n=1 Tax=Puccinia graminis f. sp. tritici TaxID=56615 RepID=A0A5B0R0N5_PUCGR|nr:hypothetical protein PGTUg99_010953 [Puccinia graminis f. sp. tritici]
MLEEHLEEWYHGPVSSPEPDTPNSSSSIGSKEYYNTRCSNRYLDRPTAFEEGYPHSFPLEPTTATQATFQQCRRSSG